MMAVSLLPCSSPAAVRRRAAALTFLEHAALVIRHLLPATAWWPYYGAQKAVLLRNLAQGDTFKRILV